ncbi:hypothetical protein DFH27DRAFT_610136 [Peziza echinospora]|nr:hypothetical protein DFH27DRAFT_610136 [Peziza echinospora]
MRFYIFTLAAAAAAIVSIVSAQNIPQCGRSCIAEAISQKKVTCTTPDVACICRSDDAIRSVAACAQGLCSPSALQTFLQQILDICSENNSKTTRATEPTIAPTTSTRMSTAKTLMTTLLTASADTTTLLTARTETTTLFTTRTGTTTMSGDGTTVTTSTTTTTSTAAVASSKAAAAKGSSGAGAVGGMVVALAVAVFWG